jgi:hypothetical protein
MLCLVPSMYDAEIMQITGFNANHGFPVASNFLRTKSVKYPFLLEYNLGLLKKAITKDVNLVRNLMYSILVNVT